MHEASHVLNHKETAVRVVELLGQGQPLTIEGVQNFILRLTSLRHAKHVGDLLEVVMQLPVCREGRVEIKDGHAGAQVDVAVVLPHLAVDVGEDRQAPVAQPLLVDGHQDVEWLSFDHRFHRPFILS